MIVKVQFKNRYTGTFSGKEYSYLCNFSPKVGDLVTVKTDRGEQIVKICDVNVPAWAVGCSVWNLKEIIGIAMEESRHGK